MRTKRLNELVNELPGRVKALPKEGRDSILIAAILDNLEESKDRLVHDKSIPEQERGPLYKDFTRVQKNPEVLFEGNKALEIYASIRETGNYAINQDIRKYENEVFGESKQGNPGLASRIYNFYNQVSGENKKRSAIKAEREQIISSLNSTTEVLEEIKDPNGGKK